MYELDYCSLLLLLCEQKSTTFSKHNIRYEYDVFSRNRHVLILSYRLNILVNIRHCTVKKPAPGILFLIVSRHADGKCFQKLKYPAVENYMYLHNVALSHSFKNMFYGFE